MEGGLMNKYMEEQLGTPLSGVLPEMQESIVRRTTYFGVRAQKNPLDAWIYQEIIHETRPDVIIEIGNGNGGGTLYLAHLCGLIGRGRVIGVDLSHEGVPGHVRSHPRITLITGDACREFDRVRELIARDERVLVIEDSSHTFDNTLAVMRLYSGLVKPGGYLIVEDGICRHGLDLGPEPGPYEAVEAFIAENPEFEIDRDRERFLITWNPKGYLRRKPGEAGGPGERRAAQVPGAKSAAVSPWEALKLFLPPIFIKLFSLLKRT